MEDGLPVYALEGYDNPVRNREILKVEGVEKAPRKRVVGKQSETARLVSQERPAAAAAPVLAVPKRRRLGEKTKPAQAPRYVQMDRPAASVPAVPRRRRLVEKTSPAQAPIQMLSDAAAPRRRLPQKTAGFSNGPMAAARSSRS